MVYPQFRSPCPVASVLDLIGDKWSLVVLRTIFAGRHRYSELAGISEKISTNILADRLARLEEYGLVTKRAYQHNPDRFEYYLTKAGADFLPILQQLALWAQEHIPDRWSLPDWFAKGKAAQFYPDPGTEDAVLNPRAG